MLLTHKDYKNYIYAILDACLEADILPEDQDICEDSMIEIDKLFKSGQPVEVAINYMLHDSIESRMINDWR